MGYSLQQGINDSFYRENAQVRTRTNHSGGIQGGISNGEPISDGRSGPGSDLYGSRISPAGTVIVADPPKVTPVTG